jgi:hypothetical protein
VNEHRFDDHSISAFVRLLDKSDSVSVQSIYYSLDTGCKIGIARLEVRITA